MEHWTSTSKKNRSSRAGENKIEAATPVQQFAQSMRNSPLPCKVHVVLRVFEHSVAVKSTRNFSYFLKNGESLHLP